MGRKMKYCSQLSKTAFTGREVTFEPRHAFTLQMVLIHYMDVVLQALFLYQSKYRVLFLLASDLLSFVNSSGLFSSSYFCHSFYSVHFRSSLLPLYQCQVTYYIRLFYTVQLIQAFPHFSPELKGPKTISSLTVFISEYLLTNNIFIIFSCLKIPQQRNFYFYFHLAL